MNRCCAPFAPVPPLPSVTNDNWSGPEYYIDGFWSLDRNRCRARRGFRIVLSHASRLSWKIRRRTDPLPSSIPFRDRSNQIQSISSITVTLHGIIEDYRRQRETEERYSSRFVFISIGGKLEEEEEERRERLMEAGMNRDGKKKGKTKRGQKERGRRERGGRWSR